ncbi:MAG TPA: NADH-quinone oxidoreductase subunit J [Gammaproteobacteria bacterium]|nr:NADH-quinone oxidoreductase subunit J [Gammaproteobacteria bacterium]
MNELVLMVALPLLTAFLLPVIDRLSSLAARWIGPLVLLLTAIIGLSAWSQTGSGAITIELGNFRPPLGIDLYVDQLALLFALAVTLGTLLLWPAEGEQRLRQSTLALLLAGSGSGLALSGDLFNIYVLYELIAVVSYGLAASRGTAAGQAATLRYLIVSAFGAALALAGIALVYQATGTLNLAQLAQLAPTQLNNGQGLAAFVLMLVGFGVKAELFPVNTWVPEVYATAPARVAGLLAGVVSKLALLIIVRLLILLFPQPEALTVMLVLGILGVLTGELAAWRARDFNRMLAFSSIGQLGIMFIAFSIPGKAGVFAGLAVALHHLVVKPALFLLAQRWGGSLEHLAGVAKGSPLAAALFILLALSLIGVPPLPGFWAKLLVMIHLLEQQSSLYALGAWIIMAGAALEANYLFRVASSFYRREAAATPPAAHRTGDLAGASLLGAALAAAVFLIVPLADRIEAMAGQAADRDHYIQTVNPEPLP